MSERDLYVGFDIGAGQGAKIGLFDHRRRELAEASLPKTEYGDSVADLADALLGCLDEFLGEQKVSLGRVRAFGIATAGLLRSDGSYLLSHNLPWLNGQNLPALISDRTGLPVAIENDANAGGLGEWSVLRTEIFYWVFGGGWGGVWISPDGQVRHPSLDWDGNDASLHVSNEPGFAIPLKKMRMRDLFAQVGVSYERFEHILHGEFDDLDDILGPGGDPDSFRAELILSGPGRCRLFRTMVGDDDFYIRFLEMSEAEQIADPATAGQHISKLSSLRVEAAVNTDRLFGKLLAEATRVVLKQCELEGCRAGTPICLGGKPSYALPYFGPSAQRALGAMGFMNYLRPSIVDERGSNANLLGACVIAEQAWGGAQG